MSNKEKYFKYFDEHKELPKQKMINGAAKELKITLLTAENYYYQWKGNKSIDEVAEKAVEQIWGEDEGKEVEKKIVPEEKQNSKPERTWESTPTGEKSKGEPMMNPCIAKPKKRLKIKELEGEIFNYKMGEDIVIIYKSTPNSGFSIKKDELAGLILELQELVGVIK
ncbi:hypothetical protein [Clostridium kluyveri]|uniref:Uncharacterized protein n=1 Tax=Clostridium kluyveri TaxID=1534 RepID=A0A1L5F8W9_CLOKL|nr:hypothetical protein [Clostridium kluyveri]APM39417.1 hypothetical protein BS101_12025 [Clostridium kluyveri]